MGYLFVVDGVMFRLLLLVLAAAVYVAGAGPCESSVERLAGLSPEDFYECLRQADPFMHEMSRISASNQQNCVIVGSSIFYGLTGTPLSDVVNVAAYDHIEHRREGSEINFDRLGDLFATGDRVHHVRLFLSKDDSVCGSFHVLIAVRHDAPSGKAFVTVYQSFHTLFSIQDFVQHQAPLQAESPFAASLTLALPEFLALLQAALAKGEDADFPSAFAQLALCRPVDASIYAKMIQVTTLPLPHDCAGFEKFVDGCDMSKFYK